MAQGCAEDASEMVAVKETEPAFEQAVATFGVVQPAVEDGCARNAVGHQAAFAGKAEAVDKTGGQSQHVLLDVEAGAGAAVGKDAGDGAEDRPVAVVVVAEAGDETEDGDAAADAAFEDVAEGVESFGDAVVDVAAGEDDQLAAVQGVAHDFVVAFEDEAAQVHAVAVVGLEPGFEVEMLPEAGEEGGVGPVVEIEAEAEAEAGNGAGAAPGMVPEAGSVAGVEIEAG